ncbi:MAG: TDT family transporter [Psychromonas sp.]|nr:TDT family transporter [Alteromonadales bacterium]MCP5076650.1 TDT family transporter [Psychromonas sp.]
MRYKIATFLAQVPIALAGLALAIASLGWCWESGTNFQGQAQTVGAMIASLILIILLLKFLFNPALLKKDLSHHMSGSVVPTFAMATMVVANNINHFSHTAALLLWLCAIVLHLVFLVVFIYYRVKNFQFEHILPSWFIPPVGIVVASVSFPGGELITIANILLLFGLVTYAILLPTILYRYFLYEKIVDHEKPTIAVFAAPASLTLAGYLTLVDNPNLVMVSLLAGISLTMTLFIYYSFTHLLRLPFTPAYSAFTFPLVIGATAMFKTAQYLQTNDYSMLVIELVESVAYIELIFATLMVGYVSLRYLLHFLPNRAY